MSATLALSSTASSGTWSARVSSDAIRSTTNDPGDCWIGSRGRTWKVASRGRASSSPARSRPRSRTDYGGIVRGGDEITQLAAARQGAAAQPAARLHHRQRMVRGAGQHRRHRRRAAQAGALARRHRVRAGLHRPHGGAARPASAHGAHRGAARRQPAGSAHADRAGWRQRERRALAHLLRARRVRPRTSNASPIRSRVSRRSCCARIRARWRRSAGCCRNTAARSRCRRCSPPRRCSSPRPGRWRGRCWAARIADYYGQSERVAFAYAFAPREYRFLPGYSHVEFVPYDSKLLPAGGHDRLYEIVGTTFWNSLMPLVRYRTGDLIRLPAAWGIAELQELALGLRSFRGIPRARAGSDRLSDGHSPYGAGVHSARSRTRAAHPGGPGNAGFGAHPRRARARVSARTTPRSCWRTRAPRSRPTCDLEVEVAQYLERTPRGKTPLIVHRPPVHEALQARRRGTNAHALSLQVPACSNPVGI